MRPSRLLPLACLVAAPALAQSVVTPTWPARAVDFNPGGTYDPAIATPAQVLGYEVGAHHTDYSGLERWLAALRRSDRVRVLQYGQSVERRPLYLVVISSPQNVSRLDEIRAAGAKLADPRTTTDAEAMRIAQTMPAVAWLNHANDGNESAAFEAFIQSSYQLAAGTDTATRQILDRLVVVLNPAHNPESHERFVAWYNAVQVGPRGTPDPQAAEHNAPWGMSTNNNHYQIDLNRDAFFQSQPETRQLVRAFREWNPVVFIDHHGQTKNMFFPPPADAVNLNVTRNQGEWMERYGGAIADAFDDRGWSYYRRGRFDLFYAGFWDSWPTLNGSVGLTFETDAGGSKGLAWEREDGTILTLREGVARHHVGAMAVLRLTARDRELRLRDLYAYRKAAMEEGRTEAMKQVVLLPNGDEARASELVDVLTSQGIEVYRATSALRLARARDYFGGQPAATTAPAGAYVIPMAQPQKRLAKALLELEPGFTREFLANEQRKKERAELLGRWSRDGFYDVTAWSLPLLFGVRAVWSEDAARTDGMQRVAPSQDFLAPVVMAGAGEPRAASVSLPAARYGYLFGPESFASMRLASALLDEGFNLAVVTENVRVLGREFAAGSIVARSERNPEALRERVAALASRHRVQVHALGGARTEAGFDLGEDRVVELRRPRIAVITDEPTDDRGYGATWFTLERRLGLPFTALKTADVSGANLSRYNVIVLPNGSPAAYQDALGEAGIARLRRWTQDGGTLVLIKGAAAMATRPGVEWTSARLRRHEMPVRLFFDEAGDSAAAPAAPAAGARGARADTAANPRRDMELVRTAGAILRVRVDPQHFLGFGNDGDLAATVQGNYAFTISREGQNVAAFPAERELRLAGFMWPEAQRAMARSLYLWTESAGRGQTILFADDPNFRATQLSTTRLFFNAVVLGPSFTR